MTMRRLAPLVVIAAATLVASGCGPGSQAVAPSASPASPQVVATPTPRPAMLLPAPSPSDASECVYATKDVEARAMQDAELAAATSIVVDAQVEGRAGPAMWNTPGGQRPKLGAITDPTPELFTPYGVVGVDPYRGSLVFDRVMVPGGTNGCDTEVYHNMLLPSLEQGERYLFFLDAIVDTASSPLDDAAVLRAWRKGTDGTYTSDTGQHRTKDQVAALLAAHPHE